jgi:hypothetical protein
VGLVAVAKARRREKRRRRMSRRRLVATCDGCLPLLLRLLLHSS